MGLWVDRLNLSAREFSPLDAMTDAMAHRGPNDRGVWIDRNLGIGLGHRRLSILDLTEAGHQPMHSSCGRWVVVFNGEIYNWQELRTKLLNLGRTFRGHSDAEVLTEALAEWGIERTLSQVSGMYAFAAFYRPEQVLYLARDRSGKKPLYIGRIHHGLVFGSELKSLAAHPDLDRTISKSALSLLLRLRYIPVPHCIYANAAKMPAASYLRIAQEDINRYQPLELINRARRYWDLESIAVKKQQSAGADYQAVLKNLDAVLRRAVQKRMVADVPVGAFLSGGIDSSVIVALMQAQSMQQVRTFSVAFPGAKVNEAPYAAAIAHHLQTDHMELSVTEQDALNVVPNLPLLIDEPFADPSQIPTYLISKCAREQVTVILSGDGGDELFSGYGRYGRAVRIFKMLSILPAPIKHKIASFLEHLACSRPEDRLRDKALDLRAARIDEVYKQRMSEWTHPAWIIQDADEPSTLLDFAPASQISEPYDRMMLLDQLLYLPDDILVKVDRASMAVGLEARAPLLDQEVIEAAWGIDTSLKIRNGQSKWVLKALLEQYVPRTLFERPKQGFSIPLKQWLAGELREWADELLDPKGLQEDGFFVADVITRLWGEYCNKGVKWHHHLWPILMFQAWRKSAIGPSRASC